MAQIDVVQAPADVLHQQAKEVTFKEPKLRQLLLNMAETLNKHEDPPGVGLAAPQVGLPLRLFLAIIGKKRKTIVFINPTLLNRSGESNKTKSGRQTLEGCLSIYNIYGIVDRSTEVTIQYQTVDLAALDSQKNTAIEDLVRSETTTFRGFEARIMEHEVDHLNGVLFTARILEQEGSLFKLERNQKGKEEWVEVEMV